MAYIDTPAPETAPPATREMYEGAVEGHGYLPNMTRLFGHRPEVMAAWSALIHAIRGNMDLRRYELVTLAAARALRSSYCMLAHGTVLLQNGLAPDALRAIAEGSADTGLTEAERAIMAYAEKVVRDATAVTPGDIDALRAHGLSDAEIFDIAAAAAVRCFFSKTLDALGAQPDRSYAALAPDLRAVLTVGRPIAP